MMYPPNYQPYFDTVDHAADDVEAELSSLPAVSDQTRLVLHLAVRLMCKQVKTRLAHTLDAQPFEDRP